MVSVGINGVFEAALIMKKIKMKINPRKQSKGKYDFIENFEVIDTLEIITAIS